MPRMLFGPLKQAGQKGAVEMRKHCSRYLRGDWQALLANRQRLLTRSRSSSCHRVSGNGDTYAAVCAYGGPEEVGHDARTRRG